MKIKKLVKFSLAFVALLAASGWYLKSTVIQTYYPSVEEIDRVSKANRYGEVLTIQGRAPTTPATLKGDKHMQAGQVRYWSFCQNLSLFDTSVDQCVYDEQTARNEKGEYLIAMSTPELRPSNAKIECGVNWLAWGRGDGIDNPQGGLLLHRHMIAEPDFKESMFAIQAEGQEKPVMGAYYPRSAYVAKAAFEARGCPVK
ncbi:MAG: hypothetical protein AAB176_13410 [Pseudomonadota bacterium]|jgi:hypothetical protein